MQLFCFASRNVDNISRGIAHKKWAVATVSDAAMAGRITKCRRYFRVGSHGLLYCNETHSFTAPFIATSEPDLQQVVTDIWPEPWVLPFSIEPLGDLNRQVRKEQAAEKWSILITRLREYASVSAALNITGTTVFVPTEISAQAWQMILDDLAYRPV